MNDLNLYKDLYKTELIENIIPFWETKSPDAEYGGYYTCFDRRGNVFDTDKFIWLQGRQVWFFAMIFNTLEKRASWLETALLGAGFMEKYGMDAEGNWYFSLTRDGKPLVQPYNIFSDCFACMAFAELFKATADERHRDVALQTFRNIQRRAANPKGMYNKLYEGSRPLKNFSLPMIMSNLALILENLIGSEEVDKTVKPLVHEVMDVFYQKDSGLILENVAPDGSFVDCFEGRCVNPGHTNEAMWFMLDLANRYGDSELTAKAVEILLHSVEYGWDSEHDGIVYFRDVKGYPLQQLEWNLKLWWVHIETLIALLKAYKHTNDSRCKQWFIKIHDYTWQHFRDTEYPEWYGYLTRNGEPLDGLKGGKWKGCFHVPRGLYQIWKTLEL